jgi:hypothetical protein
MGVKCIMIPIYRIEFDVLPNTGQFIFIPDNVIMKT